MVTPSSRFGRTGSGGDRRADLGGVGGSDSESDMTMGLFVPWLPACGVEVVGWDVVVVLGLARY
jgi:hypothetical protein